MDRRKPGEERITLSDRLYCDPHLAQFYDLDNGWHPGLDYFLKSAGRANSILDLGCGTGLFLSRIPKPHLATGVDPAGAMLEIARQQQYGGKINWIEADARTLRLDAHFE
jgi:ubiquinone/menaquinone biosynthesis C-methylase UbiE